jgi:hypothetical protein
VQERSLLEHDKRMIELALGGESFKSSLYFDGLGRSVRAYVVDKTPLETVLGIDLIIYNTCYENFLLVQYKRMEKGPDGWGYNIHPSSNIYSQLKSMDSFRAALAAVPPASPNLWSYRLNEEPFYYKFCEQFRPDARDESLVPGITMCEPHLREFLSLPEAKGRGGGVFVGYENCPRYLNNTEFVQLARVGWIGAGSQAIELIKKLLMANRKGGRRAMLSIIQKPKISSASDRVRR